MNKGEGLAWLRTDDESISQLRSPVAYKLKPVWKNRCDAGDVRFSIMLAARQKVCFKVGERPDASTKYDAAILSFSKVILQIGTDLSYPQDVSSYPA